MQYGGPILEFIPNEANTKNSRSKSLMAFTKEWLHQQNVVYVS